MELNWCIAVLAWHVREGFPLPRPQGEPSAGALGFSRLRRGKDTASKAVHVVVGPTQGWSVDLRSARQMNSSEIPERQEVSRTGCLISVLLYISASSDEQAIWRDPEVCRVKGVDVVLV